MYYWVNQGKTWSEESLGGYLWAPIRDKRGNTPYHWETMRKLKVNDLVLNYSKGFIIGYCRITSDPYDSPIPKEFEVDVQWNNEGIKVDAEYFKFGVKISLSDFYEVCSDQLPRRYSPVNSLLKVNQGYLYEINESIVHKVFNLAQESLTFENITFNFQDPVFLNETSKESVINIRIGQGLFRRKILKKWKNKCAVSGCGISSVLIASHILSWSESDNFQRLDEENGILLSPNYDSLFDKHLISFNQNGGIVISKLLSESDLRSLGINGNERIDGLTNANKEYLKIHCSKLF